MSASEVNIHATSIAVGTMGILFTGPSGAGKSTLAFACLTEAWRHDVPAALVADDRVLVSCTDGQLVARCPESIRGLLELRGSGIVKLHTVETVVLNVAIQVVSLHDADRLPPENERLVLSDLGSLPMIRLSSAVVSPLSYLAALMPGLRHERPFSTIGAQILT